MIVRSEKYKIEKKSIRILRNRDEENAELEREINRLNKILNSQGRDIETPIDRVKL